MTTHCRSCNYAELRDVISLGEQPLANALLAHHDAPEETYPLDVAYCPRCTLVQLRETVAPELLFTGYPYRSSTSSTMVEHARVLVEQLVEKYDMDQRHLVIEVGSNDGYLLQHYVEKNVPVIGYEPCRALAKESKQRGIYTHNRYFDYLSSYGDPKADVIHVHNVLAHVPDINTFVWCLADKLEPDGVIVVEVPHLHSMIDNCAWDTIYHEHVFYFDSTSLDILLRRHGLYIADAEMFHDLHGGTVRATLAHGDIVADTIWPHEPPYAGDSDEYFATFAVSVENHRAAILQHLEGLKRLGASIAAYGAAAKGAMLLNYCGLGAETIDFVVDKNTHKHFRYMPGSRLEILPVDELLIRQPDYVLLLAWNFEAEILAECDEYRVRGGRFVVPERVPRVA